MGRVECIEFKRCCCCIPLRYGLLISGYIKLITTLLVLISFSIEMAYFVKHVVIKTDQLPLYTPLFVMHGILIAVLLADISLNIVFLVGAHKKEAKLLKVYNYYSMGEFVLFVLALFLYFGADMYSLIPIKGFFGTLSYLKFSLTLGLINIGFQVYMILLTKSEIDKLENNCKFRFVNNANEAKCTLDEGENETARTYLKNNEAFDQCETINEK